MQKETGFIVYDPHDYSYLIHSDNVQSKCAHYVFGEIRQAKIFSTKSEAEKIISELMFHYDDGFSFPEFYIKKFSLEYNFELVEA